MNEQDKYIPNKSNMSLTGAMASLMGTTGWMENDRPRYSFSTSSCGVSKAKKRARKAQREARRRNRK